MPQFRLTAKMAKELKITQLALPEKATRSYDDWYVDLTRIGRKKVYVFMHITMRIALALPNFEMGGLHNLFSCFAGQLHYILKEHDYAKYHHVADEAQTFFDVPIDDYTFTKTNDKSSIRYVSDFIYILHDETIRYSEMAPHDNGINQIICDKASLYWLTNLIKDPLNPKDYVRPGELIKRVLS